MASLGRRELILAAAAAAAAGPAGAQQVQTPLKLGYQALWAPAGLVFETLRNTNIAELCGLKTGWSVFTDGGPLAEAFVGRAVDITCGGDVTVLRGTMRRPGSRVVMRCIDWRWAVLVQPDFRGKSLADLRGLRLGGSFVAGSFIGALQTIQKAGLANPERDIKLVNLAPAEAANAMQSKVVDAIVIWDPTLQQMLATGAAKALYTSEPYQALGWQSFSGELLAADGGDTAVRLVKAYTLATWWASNNPEAAIAWFAKTSRMPAEVLRAVRTADRSLKFPVGDPGDIDLTLGADDIAFTQRIIDFLKDHKLATDTIDVASLVDASFAGKARAQIKAGDHPSLADIKAPS